MGRDSFVHFALLSSVVRRGSSAVRRGVASVADLPESTNPDRDVLLVLATPEFERQWRGHGDFSVIASRSTSPPVRRTHSWVVLTAIAGMILLTVTDVLDLMEASALAAVLLIVLRAISVNEARRAVNLNVVLTIAFAVSLGTAVSVSGLATEAANVRSFLSPIGYQTNLSSNVATPIP